MEVEPKYPVIPMCYPLFNDDQSLSVEKMSPLQPQRACLRYSKWEFFLHYNMMSQPPARRQARNQGGFGGFVRTPLFANPLPYSIHNIHDRPLGALFQPISEPPPSILHPNHHSVQLLEQPQISSTNC